MLCVWPGGADNGNLGFRIPNHIHVCLTADGSVLLDLRRDRYYGVDRMQTVLLATVVPGWPRPTWADESLRKRREQNVQEPALSLCESLVSAGLLVRQYAAVSRNDHFEDESLHARRRVAICRDMNREWISIGDELEVVGRVGVRDVCNFIWAYLWVRASLGMRPFEETVEAMHRLKESCTEDRNAWEIDQVAAMVDVFRRLRTFFFAAENRCLLHALTLVKFLSRYEFHPDWMIGVTTQPWGAHSWVQWGSFLLDTNPEKMCGYVPIMRV